MIHSKASPSNIPAMSTSTAQIYAMDGGSCTIVGKSLNFDGFPDAAKVITVSGDKAAQLADLVLHAADLSFARQSLDELSAADVSKHTRESLWRSVLVHFYKCFATGCRERLNADDICKSEPPEMMETFTHLEHVRNKHLAHDVNAYAKAFVGAVINKPNANKKVAAIVKIGLDRKSVV